MIRGLKFKGEFAAAQQGVVADDRVGRVVPYHLVRARRAILPRHVRKRRTHDCSADSLFAVFWFLSLLRDSGIPGLWAFRPFGSENLPKSRQNIEDLQRLEAGSVKIHTSGLKGALSRLKPAGEGLRPGVAGLFESGNGAGIVLPGGWTGRVRTNFRKDGSPGFFSEGSVCSAGGIRTAGV